jgi:single-strand DNA-binding protein
MTEPSVSFAGNLTDNPEVRYTDRGIARAMFRVAVSGRREQEPSFVTVIVWRDQAEHAAQSLSKGSRVVVMGRLRQRSWTAEDGSARSVVEVVAEELGPSLRWATATTTRTTRSQAHYIGIGDPDRLVGSCVVLSARQACVPAKLGRYAHRHQTPAPAPHDAAVSPVGGAEASSRPETTQRSPSSGTAPRMTAT